MYLVAACTTGFLPSTVRGISWWQFFSSTIPIRICGWYTTIHFIEVLSTHEVASKGFFWEILLMDKILHHQEWWLSMIVPLFIGVFNVLIIPGGCLGSGQLTSTYPIMPQPRLRDIFVFARRFSPPLRGHVFVPTVRKLSKSGKFS